MCVCVGEGVGRGGGVLALVSMSVMFCAAFVLQLNRNRGDGGGRLGMGWGGGGYWFGFQVSYVCLHCLIVLCVNFDGKSVMSILFSNVIMVSLLYVHAKRAGWKVRSRHKAAILKLKKKKKKIQRFLLQPV